MSLTTGPRQFNFQSPKQRYVVDESIVATNGWEKRGNKMWYSAKLDLRAFSEEENKGLDLLNVALQEGGIYAYSDTTDKYPSMLVVDVITSVKMSQAAVMSVCDAMHETNFPGFIGDLKSTTQQFNTSQIIYGQWRAFAANQQLDFGTGSPWGEKALQVFQSGTFGQGDIIVGPHAYYTRIVAVNGGDNPLVYAPANIVVCSGALVELKGFQELNQMARMSAR